MSSTGFSYTARHSYVSSLSYASPMSYAGAYGMPALQGYDGLMANPLLVQGLLATREELLRPLDLDERNALADLGTPAGWTDAGLPPCEQRTDLHRHGLAVRAALLQFELLASIGFELRDGAARLATRDGAPLLVVNRPGADYLRTQLRNVQALAPLRDSRSAEILSQVAPPLAFFASVVNLQQGRHARTLELLQAGLQFAYAVGMRFKHALAVPRPVEFSCQIQPMIEVPQHPAYPAGHAVEASFSAVVLGALAGASANQQGMLDRLALRIAENRVVAGVHFPIDCWIGLQMGSVLASYFLALCGARPAWRSARHDDARAVLPAAKLQLEDMLATKLPSETGKSEPNGMLSEAWTAAAGEWPAHPAPPAPHADRAA
jgi:membrane-associated phospholipid phosphatase